MIENINFKCYLNDKTLTGSPSSPCICPVHFFLPYPVSSSIPRGAGMVMLTPTPNLPCCHSRTVNI